MTRYSRIDIEPVERLESPASRRDGEELESPTPGFAAAARPPLPDEHLRPSSSQGVESGAMTILRIRLLPWVFLACLACGMAMSLPARAEKPKPFAWQPVTPEELAMKEHPKLAGAPAMILNRESYSNDVESYETHYYRIKVFTDEGKKYADVEIPYWKGRAQVKELKARVIRPDGTAVEFQGQVLEKVLLRVRGEKLMAKVFTLPDVQPGSIVEYRYRLQFDSGRLFDTNWTVQGDLWIRKERLTLRPYTGFYQLQWVTRYLPSGKGPQMQSDGSYMLELEDVPAFEKEEHMPPEAWHRMRIDFYYKPPGTLGGEQFWKSGKDARSEAIDEFVKKHNALQRVVAESTSLSDPPETKLRKLYARVQGIRNLSVERERSEKEAQKENLKDNKNVEDVIKRGYGTGNDINLLFLGLARAAGFKGSMVWLASRDRYLFNAQIPDWGQLNASVVGVELNGKEIYLDPGTPHCPYGLLSWEQTGVQGIRIAQEGSLFTKTPDLTFDQARVMRKGTLKLDEEGKLEGTLQVTFKGIQALRFRLDALDEDEAGRRKLMEDEVKDLVPASAEITLEKVEGWEGNEEPLVATYHVKIPDMAVPTGRRLLVPIAPLHTSDKHPFDHPKRQYPVYFGYPFESEEEVTIELPSGYQVETLPQARNEKSVFGEYEITSSNDGGQLKARRVMRLNGYYFPVHVYSGLRDFYTKMRAGDEEQAILQATDAAKGQ